jgi:hypothetical protein
MLNKFLPVVQFKELETTDFSYIFLTKNSIHIIKIKSSRPENNIMEFKNETQ